MMSMTTNHVVAMPYPGRGHINPMLNLCRLLSSRNHHRTVFTFIVTEEWLGLLGSEQKPPNLNFATIPNVLPSEHVRAGDMFRFVSAVQTEMEAPVEELLDRLEQPVNLIIGDACMKWTFDVGNRRGIPVAAYWPMSAAVFSMFYHVDLLAQHHHFPVELTERGEERIDYIPGLSPMKVTDLPTILLGADRKFMDRAIDLSSVVKKSNSLLLTTIYELEADTINALKEKIQIPIYTFGPNIPFLRPQSDHSDESIYTKWLGSNPPRTVLYISLGSYLSTSKQQTEEFAAGLKQSGVKFLWVTRGETERLNGVFHGQGLVVPWCNQLRVLGHSSVGGFWTHCGWNSVKESLFAGLPMLTFPILLDQPPNSKAIVEDWKIGWKLRKGSNVLVKREEIAEIVSKFMDSENVERKEMMTRAKRMQDICQRTINEDGSAIKDLDAFTYDFSL